MDCSNVIEFLGLVIKPIHLTLVMTIATVATCGAIGWVHALWNSRGNRQMDLYVDSHTEISDCDKKGFRGLAIRHVGEIEKVEKSIPGSKVRGRLMAAAVHCNWTHRFVKHPNPVHQQEILVAGRNALVRHWAQGAADRAAGRPTMETAIVFALTGSDTEDAGVRMIRNVFLSVDDLRIVHEHPEDKWYFGGEEEDRMRVRLQTLRKMARAYFENHGYRPGKNGDNVLVVMEAFVRTRL